VQEGAVPRFALEHELAGKDDRFWKIAMDDAAQVFQLIDDIRANGHVARRRKTEPSGQIDVFTERAFDDFAGAGTDDLANRKMLGLA
jgi:hypothetical protein